MNAIVRDCRGVTLTELLVVLAILGLMSGVVSLAWHPAPAAPADPYGIAAVRRSALESGRPVRATLIIDGHVVTIAALPDGRVIAPAILHVDQLTGMRSHE